MLKMRFQRLGRKRQPTYKVVIMSSSTRRDGKPIQYLGFYNPVTKEIKLDLINIIKTLQSGVQPTKAVYNVLKKKSILLSNI